jgi:hypothetical protein
VNISHLIDTYGYMGGVIFLIRRQIAKVGLQAEAAYPGPLE